MATSSGITVAQKWDAIQYSIKNGNFCDQESTATIGYIVRGTTSDAEAMMAAYEEAPKDLKQDSSDSHGIPKRTVTISERLGEDIWRIDVGYAWSPNNADDTDNDKEVPEISFEVSGGTTHITQAYEQKCVYSLVPGKQDSDSEAEKVPIGWNGKTGEESEIAGVDVPIGQFTLTYKKIMNYSKVVSTAWLRKVAACYGRINKGRWKGWEAGEVMFNGGGFSTPMRGAKKVAVTFNFLIRINEDSVKIGGHNIGTVKGHWYCWEIYDDDPESKAGKKIKKIYKARVNKESDFSALGI